MTERNSAGGVLVATPRFACRVLLFALCVNVYLGGTHLHAAEARQVRFDMVVAGEDRPVSRAEWRPWEYRLIQKSHSGEWKDLGKAWKNWHGPHDGTEGMSRVTMLEPGTYRLITSGTFSAPLRADETFTVPHANIGETVRVTVQHHQHTMRAVRMVVTTKQQQPVVHLKMFVGDQVGIRKNDRVLLATELITDDKGQVSFFVWDEARSVDVTVKDSRIVGSMGDPLKRQFKMPADVRTVPWQVELVPLSISIDARFCGTDRSRTFARPDLVDTTDDQLAKFADPKRWYLPIYRAEDVDVVAGPKTPPESFAFWRSFSGKLEVRGLPKGRYVVARYVDLNGRRAHIVECKPDVVVVEGPDAPAVKTQVLMRVDKPKLVTASVQVQDQNGKPIADALVVFKSWGPASVARTDRSGVAEFKLEADRDYRLSVSENQYKPMTTDVTIKGEGLLKTVALAQKDMQSSSVLQRKSLDTRTVWVLVLLAIAGGLGAIGASIVAFGHYKRTGGRHSTSGIRH